MTATDYKKHRMNKFVELAKFAAVVGLLYWLAFQHPEQISTVIGMAGAYILGAKSPLRVPG